MIRDLIALPNESKVWIYQASRELSYDEIDIIRPRIYDFADAWTSHGIEVEAYGNIFHKRFLVLVADESNLGVSGCSIDTSVNFTKEMGNLISIDFFDRMQYAIMHEDESISTIHHSKFKEAIQENKINKESLIFDNLVNTKDKFLNEWIKPIQKSWHNRFIS